MSKRYLVHVPNEQFSENIMGVQFNKGKATVDEYSVDASLGRSVEEVARQMKELGYVIEDISGDAKPEEPAKPVKK